MKITRKQLKKLIRESVGASDYLEKAEMYISESLGLNCLLKNHWAELFDEVSGWRQGKAKTTQPPTERRIACRL